MADPITFGPVLGDVLIDDLVSPPPAPGAFKQGVKAGVAGMKSGLYGFGALAARGVKAAGEDLNLAPVARVGGSMEQAALANQAEQAVLASPENAPTWERASLENPSTIADAAKYSVGAFLPTLATMVAGGGVAGVGLKALGVAAEAAPATVALARNIGALASITPGSIGDQYARAKEAGAENPELSAVVGGVGGVLPYALPLGALTKFAAKAGAGGVRGVAAGAAKGIAVGAPVMAAESLVAAGVQRAAAGQDVTGPGAMDEYGRVLPDALFLGGLGGALAGAHRGMRPRADARVLPPAEMVAESAPARLAPERGLPLFPETPGQPLVVFPDGSTMTRAEYAQRQADGIVGSGRVEPTPEPSAPAAAPKDFTPAHVKFADELAALVESEGRDVEFRRAQMQLDKRKQADLDAIAKARVEELGRTPEQQIEAARVATDETPTAMAEAFARAKAGKTPTLDAATVEKLPVAAAADMVKTRPSAEIAAVIPDLSLDHAAAVLAKLDEPLRLEVLDKVAEAEAVAAAPTPPEAARAAHVAAGGAPEKAPTAPERAYPRAQAEAYAKRMTAQGMPSEVAPHPTEAGKFFIRVPESAKETPVSDTGRAAPAKELATLHTHVDDTIAAKSISAAKKAEYAAHVKGAVDAITTEARSVPEAYRPTFIKDEVKKRIGMRLPADVKGDIADHITRETSEQRSMGARSYEAILAKQRAFEGLTAAVRDPETGDIYTGPSHRQAISFAPNDPALRARLARAVDQDASMKNVGFIDANGEFIPRAQAEKMMYSKGAAAQPRTFYRAMNERGDTTKRIFTGDTYWDSHLFASSSMKQALNYGKILERIEAKPNAKIVYEGTKEFRALQKGMKVGQMSLLSFGSAITKRAEEAGYDAVHFEQQGNLGTAIIHADKFSRGNAVDRGSDGEYVRPASESNAALTQETFDSLPEPVKLAAVDAFNAVLNEKGQALTTRLNELIGKRAGVEVRTFTAEAGEPIGSYKRLGEMKAVVSMALNAKDGLSVADHEGYHFAEGHLLTSGERQIITNALKDGKPIRTQLMERLQQYDRENKTNLADEVAGSPAEARAYAFEFWRRGELKAEGALARAFEKMRQFFEKISNAVKGLGFKSMEDVFAALDRGEMARREMQAAEAPPKPGSPFPMSPELGELYSKAAVKAEREIKTREEAGELERHQTQAATLRIVDDAKISFSTLESAFGLSKDVVGAAGGSIKRWWMTNIATPNYVAKTSAAYGNVQKTLRTYLDYREILSERMLRERLPNWYKAPDVDRKASFKFMLDRTVGGWTKDSAEYRDAEAALTPQQRALRDQATGMIEGFLRAQFAKDQVHRKQQLTSEGAYDKWFEARSAQVEDMIAKGYVPLRRYGDYSVRVFTSTPDGKRVDGGLWFFDSEARAKVMAKAYQDEIARSGAKLQVEVGIRSKNVRDTGISIEQFLGTLQRNGVDISQAERERLVLTLTNSESMVRNKMMHREGLPGYSDDSMRVLHEFGVNMSGELAYAKFANAIDAAVAGAEVKTEMDAKSGEPMIAVGENFGMREDGVAHNLWEREGPMSGFHRNLSDELANFVLVPDHSGGWSKRLRGAGMVYFLGGSISGAAVNAMSVPMMVVPQLSIHTNYMNAMGVTMGAWKDAWQHYGTLRDIAKLKDPSIDIPGIDKPLREAIVAASNHIFDTEIHQMLGMSQGTVYSKSRNVQRAMEAWMSPFRVAEQTNRLTAFISAYRIASKDGVRQADGSFKRLTGQELFQFARDTVDATQNNYSMANRPGAARHPVYAMMFMFKSFPLFMVEAASLMYKQNPRAAVNMLLGLTALTGVQGLPFAQTIEDLIDTIAQNLFGSSFNSRRAMRNVIKDASEAIVGADMSDLVLNGALNEFLGVSAASRIGAGDFVPGSRLGTADADEGKILSQVLGAPYAMVKDVTKNVGGAVSGVVTGDWKKTADALRAGGPIAVRNLAKGAEQLETGAAYDAKGRKVVDVTTLDGMLQLGGFSSAAAAKAYDLESINIQTKAFYTQVGQDLQVQMIKAIRDGDVEKVQQLNDLRNKWNRENPTMPIAPNAASLRRAIMLAGVPLDRRSQMQWGRNIRGNNIFSEQPDE